MTDTMISQNIELSFWDILYTNRPQSNASRRWNDVIMNVVKAVELEFKKITKFN